jgi:SAM-dependent methyltransferase
VPGGTSLFVCRMGEWESVNAADQMNGEKVAGAGAAHRVWRARALSAAFELLYHNRTLYWLASTIPFAGQWRTWQRRVLPRIHGQDVLEVGCGLGTLLADMLAAGYRCRAVDVSEEMVEASRARLRRSGQAHPEELVTRASVRQLPFPDASFDSVVSTFPTPYIYDAAALGELARVLRPGGRLIVVEGASLLPANVLLRPLVLLQAAVYGQSVSETATKAHLAVASGRHDVRTLPLSPARSRIPLERVGLTHHEEMDVARWWVVLVVIGDKPEAPSEPA